MDFFDQNAPHALPSSTVDAAQFAEALQRRDTFVVPAPSPRMVQALGRSAVAASSSRPEARPLPSKPPPPVSSSFSPIQPEDLPTLISNPTTLVVDIRPHGQWKKAHIQGAINLAVPSTLLRRPNFSLEKLSSMLPNAADREAFKRWETAQVIVVCDADSTALPESSNVLSLLNKLKAANAQARLGYLYGGLHSAILSAVPGLIASSMESEEEEATTQDTSAPSFLSVRQLSMSAFQQGTTTNAGQRPADAANSTGAPAPMTTRVTAANPFYDNIRQHMELAGGITERIPLYIPKKILKRSDDLPFEWLKDITQWAGVVTSESEHADGTSSKGTNSTDGTTSSGRSSFKLRVKANVTEGMEALAMQFYRIELGEQRRLQGVMDQHSRESGRQIETEQKAAAVKLLGGEDKVGIFSPRPTQGPQVPKGRKSEDPYSSIILRNKSGVEKAEGEVEEVYFPYSITAGIEKGTKNRYRNIWPFDHARVRLQHTNSTGDDSDYINASYIQPRGTNRHYIATQGPLPSTYPDFWSLVWEQSVRILVMLTKRVEGHSVKCGLYWKDGKYGPLNLKLVREEGGTEGERAEENCEGDVPMGGFEFNVSAEVKAKKARRAKVDMHRQVGGTFTEEGNSSTGLTTSADAGSSSDDEDDSIIRREFLLWHDDDPTHPRTIVQFQYVGWPDLNVPSTPRYLLKLIKEINLLYEEYKATGVIGKDESSAPDAPSTSNSRFASHVESRHANAAGLSGKRKKTASEILVHCSAGVGRTGSFVLIDAVLDAVKRETKAYLEQAHKVAEACEEDYDSDRPAACSTPQTVDMSDLNSEAGSIRQRNAFAAGFPPPFSLTSQSMPGGSSLPDMEHLSMQSALSSSPPKAGSFFGEAIHTPDTPFTSPLPSAKPQGAPSLFQRRLASGSLGGSTFAGTGTGTGAVDAGATLFSAPSVADNLRGGRTPTTRASVTFDHMTPRQITIPRHSRANHPQSQVARVLAKKEEARLRKGRSSRSKPLAMDVDLKEADETKVEEEDDSSSTSEEPSPLSSLDEPVRQVLEGMREQRMSMCQSLRQYVFVHRAIVEGAIQIVDELNESVERQRAEAAATTFPTKSEHAMDISVPQTPNVAPPTIALESPTSPFTRKDMTFHLGTLPPPAPDFLRPSGLGSKRLASPTELVRMDVHGDHTISKRPSLKRINKSYDSTSAPNPAA